jgi:hypothetical protein
MSLTDSLISSIQAELAVLKGEEAAAAPAEAAPTPAPVVEAAPAPAPVAEENVPPVIAWARKEAAERQAHLASLTK